MKVFNFNKTRNTFGNVVFCENNFGDVIKSCFTEALDQQKTINIGNKKFIELTNVVFEFDYDKRVIEEVLETPHEEDKKERDYLIYRLADIIEILKKDINSRQAVFSNLYENGMGKCISLVHFFVREGKANLNTYFRSQEASKNFYYDYQTHMILMKIVTEALKVEPGKIETVVANFHLEMK